MEKSQEPCEKCEVGNPCLYCEHEFSQKIEPTVTSTDEPMMMVYPTIVCDDAISREAVNGLQRYRYTCGEKSITCVSLASINELPPVQPIRKGHWLHKEITDDYRVTGQCSECKYRKIIDNFCPNCGADMREGSK